MSNNIMAEVETQETEVQDLEAQAQVKSTNLTRISDLIEKKYAARLSWDVHKSQIRFDGIPISSILSLRVKLEKEEGNIIPEDILTNLAHIFAWEKPYSEVAEYLRTNYEKNKDHPQVKDKKILQELVNNRLHVTNGLETTYVIKFMIGCVARALNSGCKMDTALILSGKQGLRKTTFFEVLAGKHRFMSMSHSSTAKDSLKEAYKYWIIEYGEFDSQLTPNKLNQLKNYMSQSRDEIRPLYVNTSETKLRHFVHVGTTNKEQFLIDPTGNRRFWVVNVPEKIDTEWVAENRDLIWARAMQLYLDSKQWHLTEKEQATSDNLNAQYNEVDIWEDKILSWANGQSKPFRTCDVLQHLDIPTKLQNRGHQNRVVKVLKQSPYKEIRKVLEDGSRPCFWEKES